MRSLFWLAVLVALVACNKSRDTSSRAGQSHSKTNAPTSIIAESEWVVEPLDEARLERLLKQRNGKALLLNVWATWCVPCKEEFPDLVRLAQVYQNRGAEIVGLSVDYPDEVASKIVPFLKNKGVNFRVFVGDFKDDEKFINRLNQKWSGALPATFIFDSSGNQRAFLLGKQTFPAFQRALENVLTQSRGR
ncbi:MAG: redoxin domain-containing protein [bacterium]